MSREPDTDALVRYVITSLVDHPEAVDISRRVSGSTVTYEVSVHSEDVGKVIGRQGRIIKAIRTLARAAAGQQQEHVDVEVVG